jgi:hypothetical protein
MDEVLSYALRADGPLSGKGMLPEQPLHNAGNVVTAH